MEEERQTTVFPWLDGLTFNRFHASTLILCGLTLVSAGYSLQVLAYALPLIVKEWTLSPLEGGALISYGLLGLMFGAVCFGAMADRIGRKKCLLTAVFGFSLLSGGASLVQNYASLCVIRFLMGVGIGGAFPLAVAMLSEFSPPGIRARVVTAAVSGFTFGWAVAASASMALIPVYGWRPVFRLGLLPLLLLPIIWAFLPESVRFLVERARYPEAMRALKKIERIAGLAPVQWRREDLLPAAQAECGKAAELFRGGLLWMTLLVGSAYLLNTMALYGLSSWLPSLLVKEGFSLVKSYGYTMVQAGGSAAGGFLLGCIMDRFGRKPGLVLTYFLGGISVISFGSVTTDLGLFLAGAATGVFVVGTPTALNVVCSEIFPTRLRATGVAATQAAGRIGSILGPMLGGGLQQFGFTFHQFFFLFSIPCFLCVLLVALYPVDVKGEPLESVTRRFLAPGGAGRSGR